MNPEWKPAASKGEFDLDILTRARARADMWMIGNDSEALCIVMPWGAPPLPIHFKTFQRVREFVGEMKPCVVRCFGTEDEAAMVARLQAELVGDTVPAELRVH